RSLDSCAIFPREEATISSFRRSFSKGWTWNRFTRRQKNIIEPSSPVASLPIVFHSTIAVVFHVFGIPKTWKCQQGIAGRHFDVSRIPRNVIRTVFVFRARLLGGNRNEKRRRPGCL